MRGSELSSVSTALDELTKRLSAMADASAGESLLSFLVA